MHGQRLIVLGWRNTKPWVGRYRQTMACIWLNAGSANDLRRARRYAEAEGYRVFVFPLGEPFPLRAAKMMM